MHSGNHAKKDHLRFITITTISQTILSHSLGQQNIYMGKFICSSKKVGGYVWYDKQATSHPACGHEGEISSKNNQGESMYGQNDNLEESSWVGVFPSSSIIKKKKKKQSSASKS